MCRCLISNINLSCRNWICFFVEQHLIIACLLFDNFVLQIVLFNCQFAISQLLIIARQIRNYWLLLVKFAISRMQSHISQLNLQKIINNLFFNDDHFHQILFVRQLHRCIRVSNIAIKNIIRATLNVLAIFSKICINYKKLFIFI